jgi:hypothetical protein
MNVVSRFMVLIAVNLFEVILPYSSIEPVIGFNTSYWENLTIIPEEK